jgi:hypothetical protein
VTTPRVLGGKGPRAARLAFDEARLHLEEMFMGDVFSGDLSERKFAVNRGDDAYDVADGSDG